MDEVKGIWNHKAADWPYRAKYLSSAKQQPLRHKFLVKKSDL